KKGGLEHGLHDELETVARAAVFCSELVEREVAVDFAAFERAAVGAQAQMLDELGRTSPGAVAAQIAGRDLSHAPYGVGRELFGHLLMLFDDQVRDGGDGIAVEGTYLFVRSDRVSGASASTDQIGHRVVELLASQAAHPREPDV